MNTVELTLAHIAMCPIMPISVCARVAPSRLWQTNKGCSCSSVIASVVAAGLDNDELNRSEKAHEDGIWSVAWTESDKILSGSVDERARVWTPELAPLHSLKGHRLGVLSVRAFNEGKEAVTSSIDSCIRFWDLETGEQTAVEEPGPVEAWTLAVSKDDKLLASGTQKGSVNVWALDGHKKVASVETRDKFVMSVAFSPNNKWLASGGLDGLVNIFDVQQMKLHQKLEGHAMPIRSLCFSADGSLLFTASDDMRVNVYDVANTSLVASFTGHTSWVLSVDCCADGRHFATGGSDQMVKIWDMAAKECVHTFDSAHNNQVWSVAYSPTGDKLVSGCDDGVLQVYERA